MKVKIISNLYYLYIKLVYITSKIEFVDIDESIVNSIVGFWHGDSFLMNMILCKFQNESFDIMPLITEDPRGEYIVKVAEKLNAKPIIVLNDVKIIQTMKEIKRKLLEKNIIAIALDGPLGPKHKPKSMAYRLSKNSGRPMIRIEFQSKRKIILSKRWDDYIIPLPFGVICAKSVNLGVITKEKLSEVKSEINAPQ